MFWHQSKLKTRHLALAAILLSGAAAASADILVVRSTGPSAKSYPPGKSLKDDIRINLQANDAVVVLDGRGTRTLRGPGSYTPGGPVQASSRSSLTGLTSTTPRRARIGAVRGMAGIARTPSIWHIDVAKSSTVCLADPANVQLWRADATQPVTITVAGGRDNRSHDALWAAGQSTIAWPAEVAIADGTDYRLSWPGAAAPTMLRFRTLPAKPVGLEDMASSLIQNGCEAQLDTLIETVKLPEEETPTAG